MKKVKNPKWNEHDSVAKTIVIFLVLPYIIIITTNYVQQTEKKQKTNKL